MEVKYNVSGAQRKELAQVISKITGAKAEYQFMPTCAYEIDFFTLTKDGTLEYPDSSDSETVEKVLKGIAKAGFECESTENAEAEEAAVEESATEEAAAQEAAVEEDAAEEALTEEANSDGIGDTDDEDADEPVGLTISIPLDKVNVGNLKKLLDAKGDLIKKALSIDVLPIEVDEDAVSFPWFNELPEPEEVTAYTHLIAELCRMSKEQNRITATAKDVDNEKYAFRCFLLRLGFIGEDYKKDRKILLRNLSGSSAFKGGARDEDAE